LSPCPSHSYTIATHRSHLRSFLSYRDSWYHGTRLPSSQSSSRRLFVVFSPSLTHPRSCRKLNVPRKAAVLRPRLLIRNGRFRTSRYTPWLACLMQFPILRKCNDDDDDDDDDDDKDDDEDDSLVESSSLREGHEKGVDSTFESNPEDHGSFCSRSDGRSNNASLDQRSGSGPSMSLISRTTTSRVDRSR